MATRPLSQLLTDDLGLMPQDVIAHVAVRYGPDHGLSERELIDVVRQDLDPHCIRSAPAYWWGTGERDGLCRCVALGGREHRPGPACPSTPVRPGG